MSRVKCPRNPGVFSLLLHRRQLRQSHLLHATPLCGLLGSGAEVYGDGLADRSTAGGRQAAGGGRVVSVGGFRLPPAGLGFASEVSGERGGGGAISRGAARGFGLRGRWRWRGLKRGWPPSDAPPSARAKREMLIRWALCAARSKTLALGLFFCLFNHSESYLGTIMPRVLIIKTNNVFGLD